MEQKSSSQCQKLPASSFCHLRTPSQFPSPISTDSLCSSFGMAGNSCSCTCRVLQKIQVIFYSFDLLMSAVCWHLPASSLLSNTNSLTQHTSSSQDHHLYRPARTPEVALTQGLWCIRRAAPDDATVPGGASPALLSTKSSSAEFLTPFCIICCAICCVFWLSLGAVL